MLTDPVFVCPAPPRRPLDLKRVTQLNERGRIRQEAALPDLFRRAIPPLV